ncbi:MAG: hypothetical protein Q8O37_00650 [Sulfuricellaceae bacterium]|nr:hypothetical protein [Sulfuricellaceae bacterium]
MPMLDAGGNETVKALIKKEPEGCNADQRQRHPQDDIKPVWMLERAEVLLGFRHGRDSSVSEHY